MSEVCTVLETIKREAEWDVPQKYWSWLLNRFVETGPISKSWERKVNHHRARCVQCAINVMHEGKNV